MKRLWALYLFCTALGGYSIYKSYTLIGPYPITDGRHSVAFYVWEMIAGTCLLVVAIGLLIFVFDLMLEK